MEIIVTIYNKSIYIYVSLLLFDVCNLLFSCFNEHSFSFIQYFCVQMRSNTKEFYHSNMTCCSCFFFQIDMHIWSTILAICIHHVEEFTVLFLFTTLHILCCCLWWTEQFVNIQFYMHRKFVVWPNIFNNLSSKNLFKISMQYFIFRNRNNYM